MFSVSRFTGEEGPNAEELTRKRKLLGKLQKKVGDKHSKRRTHEEDVALSKKQRVAEEDEKSAVGEEKKEESMNAKVVNNERGLKKELQKEEKKSETVETAAGEAESAAGEVRKEEDAFDISREGLLDVKKRTLVENVNALPPWMTNSMNATETRALADVPALEGDVKEGLDKMGIEFLFPVQSLLIEQLVDRKEKYNDFCVSAPTGSGKTLSYVVPVVNELCSACTVRRLKALVIVPTRDLAVQVKSVFEQVAQMTGLKIGIAAGQQSFGAEQANIVEEGVSEPYQSKVDVLIVTPGRLVDHIDSTKGFTLRFLRFLIVDEADRLMNQSYFNWLEKTLGSIYSAGNECLMDKESSVLHRQYPIVHRFQKSDVVKASSFSCLGGLPLQKLLFSATLTKNPEKLNALKLWNPRYISALTKTSEGSSASLGQFSVPSGLSEYMLVCSAGEKPLVLVHFLKSLKMERVLCFTSSLESTHRLYLLLKGFSDISVAEFSSNLTPEERRKIISKFKRGDIQIVVCSDAMARGIDIENVSTVISYDVPVYVKTYIHRVGRTARAGQTGNAYTFLKKEQVRHFKEMRQGVDSHLKKIKIKRNLLEPFVEEYETALGCLKESLANEK
eukprot:Nk52_evm6s368 gene=Nk52_evmTU6s368